ncbi:uncharacterized protein LOC128720827 [Anopheles nili]|uniref:uncharacterized protein LOC128720827 n=1 Tax=Anopheles nili TaxID=185578 RepID=UPI00237B323F|nr:uncharacterized protein LOC128720827 [Anopheles nili]
MYKYFTIAALVLAYSAGNASAFSCFTCTTFNSTNCLVPDLRNLVTDCGNPSDIGEATCFTRVLGRDVERGCITSLTQEERDNCNLVNNCQLCANTNDTICNDNIFPHGRMRCHQCEGTTNSTCSEEIMTEPSPCLHFVVDDQCFVQVEENSVVRGCLSQNEGCRNSTTCHVCAGIGCNSRHFEYNTAASLVAHIQTLIGAIMLSVLVANKF